MANGFRIKRGTAAQITAAGATNSLNLGEPYLISDQNRLAVGTSSTTFEPHAKLSEVLAKQDTLVSGSNIKTVNGSSLLGSGNLVLAGTQPQVFIQNTQPADTGTPYLWIETGLPDNGVRFWYNENGVV